MKISTNNNIINNYTDLHLHAKEHSAPSVTPNDEHSSFDAIIIKSNPRQIEEHTFAKSVSRQLSDDVRNTASTDRIEQLKGQIANHSYSIDAYAIASRILLV